MWEEVFEYSFDRKGPSKKEWLGGKANPQICKFCGKGEPEITFSAKAHVIAKAFGNRTLLSRRECDACNHEAGETIEDDLVKSLSLIRAIAGHRSHRGSVRHQLRKKGSSISSRVDSNIVTVELYQGERNIIVQEFENNEFELKVKIPSFRPANVARALARMALFVLDLDTDPNLHRVCQWVRRELDLFPLKYQQLFLCGMWPRRVVLSVSRSLPGSGLPPYRVIFAYSITALIMYLPEANGTFPSKLPPLTLPSFFSSYEPELYEIMITGDCIIKNATQSIILQYGEREGSLNPKA